MTGDGRRAAGPETSRGSGYSTLRWWRSPPAPFSQSQLGMLNGVISIPNVALTLLP
ncbi:MAG: hypothetical protein NVS1B6_11560 [Steroidobacteraceae bacterium]